MKREQKGATGRTVIFRGLPNAYDPDYASDREDLVFWTLSRELARTYAGRGLDSTLLSCTLPAELRIKEFSGADEQAYYTESEWHAEQLRTDGYDGVWHHEAGRTSIGLLPEISARLKPRARTVWE